MHLIAPSKAPRTELTGIRAERVPLAVPRRLTLISFFRDPDCPFCNLRLYELCHNHERLADLGLKVVVVIAGSTEEIRGFVEQRTFLSHRAARPAIVADPDSSTYEAFGVTRRSLWGKLHAIVTRVPSVIRGLRLVGLAGLNTSNLMPADFLIDEHGYVVETWYGHDAGDRIPLERVEVFLLRRLRQRAAHRARQPAFTGLQHMINQH